ncbi:hypothetical protein ACYX78_17180 [Advenella incenata]
MPEKVQYVLTPPKEKLDVLRAMATGSIERLNEKLLELGLDQKGAVK